MSWNKNTINHSEIDATINLLKKVGINYELRVLGKVQNRGLGATDDCDMRRLSYEGLVMLETIYRTSDCDADDVISSVSFESAYEPKDWKLEVYEEEYEGV